jgi:hypothetical protein
MNGEMPEENACVFWCAIADVTAVTVYPWRSERPAADIWSLYGRFMERTLMADLHNSSWPTHVEPSPLRRTVTLRSR